MIYIVLFYLNQLDQGGLNLGMKHYYIDSSSQTANRYRETMETVAFNLGVSKDEAVQFSVETFQFESQLAEVRLALCK